MHVTNIMAWHVMLHMICAMLNAVCNRIANRISLHGLEDRLGTGGSDHQAITMTLQLGMEVRVVFNYTFSLP